MHNYLVQPLGAAIALVVAPVALATRIKLASLGDLADLSLEQLSNIEVTSVSGRAEPLRQARGFHLRHSAQDIRRSGALTLPEVLRLAPNLQVAQVSAGQYAISARGFNNTIANKRTRG